MKFQHSAMRKRSASESGRGSSPISHSTPSKVRKSHHSNSKEETTQKAGSKCKQSFDPISSTKRKFQVSKKDEKVNSHLGSNSVHSNQTSADGPYTRESRKASLNSDTKHKQQEPLPDIMHDWEIIVNSLRENKPNGEATSKINPKAENFRDSSKASLRNSVRSAKIDFTDSDKENTTFKKKTEEFATPNALSSRIKFSKLASPKEENSPKKEDLPKQNISPSKSEHPEDPALLWRRPTRSTYKAFEDVCDPSLLADQEDSKDPSISNGNLQNVSSSEAAIEHTASTLDSSNVSNLHKMYSLKKKLNKPRESSPMKRRITRQMEKAGLVTEDNLSSQNSEDENSQMNSEQKEYDEIIGNDCFVVLTKSDFEDSFDLEPDFLGFNSPEEKLGKPSPHASTKKRNYQSTTSPLKSPRKTKVGRPRKRIPKEKSSPSPSPVRQIIEECKLDETESDDAIEAPRNSSSVDEQFELFFGSDESHLPCNFEGFNHLHPKGRYCSQCCVLLRNMEELRQHKKIAHKRIYACIFDTGNCGQFKGSIAYGSHLATIHKNMVNHLSSVVQSDIKFGRVANWIAGEEVCSVCLVSLSQPGKCLHEILMHGLWPPSILNLVPVAIDQYISLWWTGKNVAFACRLCQTSQSTDKNTPIILSSANALPNLVANHLRNVHLINLPLIQGWWLLIQLLISLPYSQRRTLSSLIMLTANNEPISSCSLCNATISKSDLNRSSLFCPKCENKVLSSSSCWFLCADNQSYATNPMDHLLEKHQSLLPGGWCVHCGQFDINLILHLTECPPKEFCKFCNTAIGTLSTIAKAIHSYSLHSYSCPLPNCSLLQSGEKNKITTRFATSSSLSKHLVSHHFPEWKKYRFEEIYKLIGFSKGNRGFMLTHNSSKDFTGYWISLNNYVYALASNILSPVESIKFPRICFLCMRTWNDTLLRFYKEFGSVCQECLAALTHWDNGTPCTYQCPVFSCLESISTVGALFQHLVTDHKLENYRETKKFRCCADLETSPISTILHNLNFHCQACLACEFTAPTAAQIKSHRSIVHGFLTWNSLFHHLKAAKIERKMQSQYGVMRVWQGDIKTQAQLDPSIDISSICEEIESDPIIVLDQSSYDSPQALPEIPMDDQSNETDPLCSFLCTVSMSPCKVADSNTVSLDRDIQEEASDVLRKLNMSKVDHNGRESDYNSASPDLLIPTSVNESSGQQSSSHSIGIHWNINGDEAPSPNSASSGEAPLKIDSSTPSPELSLRSAITENSDIVNGNAGSLPNQLTVTIPVSSPASSSENIRNLSGYPLKTTGTDIKANNASMKSDVDNSDAPQLLKFMDSVNIMVAETLESMTKSFSKSLPPVELKKAPFKQVSNAKKEKGLGENASFNETSMAENILKDLDEKFSSTCIECGVGIHLPDLSYHLKSRHSGKISHCSCGFRGELNSFLVHSFHMSHIPCEARPFLFGRKDSSSGEAIIVLEARAEIKALTYPCFKCGKRFKQEKSRQLHYNLCKLEKKFGCDLCGEKFALENHLLKHKEWKHNPQICTYCKKVFTSSSSLTQHVQHIHKKPLVHHCKLCKDSFNTLSQLKVHMRTHTGEEPHTCHICLLGFISRNLLKKHLASDHKEESSSDDERSETENPTQKEKKLSKRKSSTDSSSEDSILNNKGSKKMKYEDTKIHINLKNLPLTESDLETSLSESERITLPKKSKAQKGMITPKRELIVNNPAPKQGESADTPVLPNLRPEVRERVKNKVGKICNPCGQEFESPVRKLLHLYLIHPGFVLSLGFNQCCFCDFKFSSADDVSDHHLTVHQRTFLPNGNFRCLCGLTFREDGAYYFHLYYAHKAQRALNIGGEIVCRLCQGRPRLNKIVDLVVHLSDRHTMFDHVRFNDSYMCNLCYKAFESWTVLSLHFFMVHKATKSQTLSYDCPYCQGASPWHSLEALQYHLDNVHRGRHNKSQPVPEHTRGIYTPAPSSPTKKKDTPARPNPPKRQRKPKQPKFVGADPDLLYCTCQCPYDEVSDMIGCDNPDCKYQWFHFECVGIMAAPEGNWYCPDCTSFAQEKEKEDRKKRQIQADLYEYYSNLQTEEKKETKLQRSSNSSNSSSSGSSSSSSSNSSSSSSSSSDSSSESDAN